MSDDKKLGAAIGGLVLVFIVAVLLLAGAQTSTILSKVGSSVGGSSVEDQSGAGSTGDSSGSSGEAGGSGSAGAGGPVDGGPAQVAAVQPLSLLIVHTGSLTLEVTSIDQSVTAAAGVVTRAGGFVAGSKEAGTGSAATAAVTYRIPAAAWEPALAALRDVGIVRDQEIKADEVTGTVLDLGARITNLQATEAALQAIMAKAARIDDVLAVQKQLTDTRGQIEELSAKKAGLENQAAFGSLTATFRLPPPAATLQPTARPPVWDPAADAQQAAAKLVRIGQKAGTAGIWFAIVGLPLLVALAAAIAIGWGLYRASRRIRRSADAAA